MKAKLLSNFTNFLNAYKQPNMLKIWVFGFSSGLALFLSGNTLNFWLAKLGVSTITIGLFSLVALPYACKYAVAPLVDRVDIPYLSRKLGRRKAWIFLSQLLLITFLIRLSQISPKDQLTLTAIYGFFIALFSVTQDIALDAYRISSLKEGEQGPGSAMYIFGYRVGMLVSGGGAIYLSSYLPWGTVYQLMALCVTINMIAILFTRETSLDTLMEKPQNAATPLKWIYNVFFEPFEKLGNLKHLTLILGFVLLYRLSDNLIATMANPFFLSVGFDEKEIATAAKFFGVIAALIGGVISGYLIPSLSITRSLLIFGGIHVLSHILFILQAWVGHNLPLLYVVIGIENITSGMAMTAYIAYISGMCQGKYAGTQYALLSSMMGLSRVALPSLSGFVVEYTDWQIFFMLVVLSGIPALLLIPFLKK
jgi:PAT family beta-lactamase induction signal transducer AmpG